MKKEFAFWIVAFASGMFTAAWWNGHVQAQTQLFRYTGGDTYCTASISQPSPLKVAYFCSNPRGSTGGSYTANSNNTATDVLTLGLANGGGSGTLATGMVTCMMGINTTSAAINLGSLGTVAPNSVNWQCSGMVGGQSGTQAF